ncbi:restriction endonuclease subunit S [Lysobacter sp. D1-1-M9]|uniref:restriction endonuclease subunit S n=1 Tax=Novilysobacter longmucuonensis TaxID=3098603 RepID=UPI002FC6E9B7
MPPLPESACFCSACRCSAAVGRWRKASATTKTGSPFRRPGGRPEPWTTSIERPLLAGIGRSSSTGQNAKPLVRFAAVRLQRGPPPSYWDGDIPWASVKDIGKSKYVDDTIDRISRAGLDSSSSNLIQPGSLIVVTRMGLGKVSINRITLSINQDLRALSLSSLVSIDYIYLFFKTLALEGSGLTVKGIKLDELLRLRTPLPPLAEQHRIVSKVEELMALCSQLQAARNAREQQRDRLVASSLHRITANDAGESDVTEPTTRRAKSARFHLRHLLHLSVRHEHIRQLRQAILNLAVRGKLTSREAKDEACESLMCSPTSPRF